MLVALPALVALASSSAGPLAEQAFWVLGNMAAEADDLRCALIAAGALVPLHKLVTAAAEAYSAAAATPPSSLALAGVSNLKPQFVCTAVWALGNCARPGATPSNVFLDLAPPLLALVGRNASAPPAVASEAAWALSFVTAREEPQVRHRANGKRERARGGMYLLSLCATSMHSFIACQLATTNAVSSRCMQQC